MSVVFGLGGNAFWGGAGFVGAFEFEGGVADAVFGKFLAYLCLYLVRVAVGDDVHCDTGVYSVYTPQMDMMHVFYAVYLFDMLFYLRDRNAVGSFLQKQINDVF